MPMALSVTTMLCQAVASRRMTAIEAAAELACERIEALEKLLGSMSPETLLRPVRPAPATRSTPT